MLLWSCICSATRVVFPSKALAAVLTTPCTCPLLSCRSHLVLQHTLITGKLVLHATTRQPLGCLQGDNLSAAAGLCALSCTPMRKHAGETHVCTLINQSPAQMIER